MSFNVEFFPFPCRGERIGDAGREGGVKVCQSIRALSFLSASSDIVTGDRVKLVHGKCIGLNLFNVLLLSHHHGQTGDQTSIEP